MEKIRKIVIPDFDGKGEHLYEDMLGWQSEHKNEAHSFVSKEIFEDFVVERGLSLPFYYVDNDTFYGIHTDRLPIELKILPRDRTSPFIYWQCDGNTHYEESVVMTIPTYELLWDTIKIDGKSLEEVLERSVIMTLN